MLKMTIDNEEVLSKGDFTIKEEMLGTSSTILNNTYPKSWEEDHDYTSKFFYPKDYSKLNIQNFNIEPEEAGKTIQINGSATLTDVDTTKESRVLRLLGQTSQNGTPTPSSPIPVNVVSGDNEINICGKNKLSPTSDFEATHNGVTFKGNNGIYTIKGTATGGSASISKTLLTKEYTIKNGDYLHLGNTSVSTSSSMTYFFTDNTNDYRTFNTTNRIVDLSSYVGKTINGISFWVANNLQIDLTIMPMILNISTATTYEPYIGNSYPIYLGVENLFKASDGTFTRNGITATINDDIITLNGTATANVYLVITSTEDRYTHTFSGDYIVSKITNATTVGSAFYGTDSGGTDRAFLTINDNASVKTQAINGTYTNIRVQLNIPSGATYNNTIVKIQLEKGSKANSFTPYGTTPIELCKIGTYQDYIYKDNGSWYLHKEIGKVVLDGSRNWIKSGNTNIDRFVLSGYVDYGDTNCFSNYFDNGVYSDTDYTKNQIFLNTYSSTKRIIINYSTVGTTTLAQFKNWLSTHNTIVYYVLATPTNTLIEDTTLIEQLEALSS